MKQFSNILKFELYGYLKNKAFIGISVVLVILMGITLSFPRFLGMFGTGSDNTTEQPIIAISDVMSKDKDITITIFQNAMPNNTFIQTDKSIDELITMVDNNELQSAVVIDGQTQYTYIVKNVVMYDTTKYIFDEIMTTKYRIEKLAELGISVDKSDEILTETIKSDVIQTGKNQVQNFFYTYILIFVLYMAILLYGQFVAMSVASEKSSRAIELLITSAKPTNLIFGKVIGSGIAGLLQMSVILGSSFVFFNINKSYWGDNEIVNSIFNMPLSILLYTILFFILGYFIYSFLYGAVGSLVSKVEDVNTFVMPITLLFIFAFMVVFFSISSGNIDNPLMMVASYIPFTSPMAMFVRIAMGEVATYEIVISVAILILSTLGIGYLSAKIYKIGVLLYGKPPKLSNIIKAMMAK